MNPNGERFWKVKQCSSQGRKKKEKVQIVAVNYDDPWAEGFWCTQSSDGGGGDNSGVSGSLPPKEPSCKLGSLLLNAHGNLNRESE